MSAISSDEQFEPLKDLIYSALFGETTWQHFLDALTATMPNGKSTLFFHDSVAQAGGLSLTSGFEPEDVENYNQYYYRLNPWMPRAAVRPIGVGVIAEQMLDRKALTKTEFYQDFIRGIGCENSVGVTVMREQARSFNLAVLTSSNDLEFNRVNAELLSDLAPHLRRAFNFLREDRNASQSCEMGSALFDAIGVGLVYLTEEQKIRSMNAAAQQLLPVLTDVTITQTNRLIFRNETINAALAALTSRTAPRTSGLLTEIVKGIKGAFKCTLVRLQSDLILDFIEGPTVALIIEPMSGCVSPQQEHNLAQRYRLTAAEIRVASGIAAGLSLREIAIANEVSYETARSQLKSAYGKLGVNSQVGLVRLLIS
ncbi:MULTISPECIES: helix-turn-helix transcriptional regulator [unclassified Sinorhizobium]|uniref:helix-turn-helix transcriptional regulator n=1 Tax=unclassified Sinorhizobium TaxID=2613772 RepID=UPI0035263240